MEIWKNNITYSENDAILSISSHVMDNLPCKCPHENIRNANHKQINIILNEY